MGYTVTIIKCSHRTYLRKHRQLFNDDDPGKSFCHEFHRAGTNIYLDMSRPVGKLMEDVVHEWGHTFIEWSNYVHNLPGADPRD